MTFLQNFLSESPIEKRWMSLRIEAVKNAPDGAKRWLKDLGKNDFEHAESEDEYVGNILLESGISLSHEEYYLLLHAIYVHDIGYRISPENHPKKSYEMILEKPETYFI